MTLQAVARRYAAALFDVVQKTGEIDRTERDLSAVRALVDGHADLRQVWESAGVPPVKKRALVDALLAGGDLADYQLAHAARADLCRRLDRKVDAKESYERALALTRQEPERRFLERRLAELKK